MEPIDRYLYLVQEDDLIEGKVWDKTKKFWKDHKGKIIAGTAALGAAAAAYGGKKAYDKTGEKTDKEEKSTSDSDAMVKNIAAGRAQASQASQSTTKKDTASLNRITSAKKSTSDARKELIKKNIAYADFKDRKDAESDAIKKSVDQGASKEIYNKYNSPTYMGKKVGKFLKNAKQARKRLANQNKTSKNRGVLNKLFSKTGA